MEAVSTLLFGRLTNGSVSAPGHQMLSASPTITLNLHLFGLPHESEALAVTTVSPSGKNDPEAGSKCTGTAPSQWSWAKRVGNTTCAPWFPGSLATRTSAGQL